ncbi:MAG: hypothetical protein ACRCWR_01885 [Saezia sp.]
MKRIMLFLMFSSSLLLSGCNGMLLSEQTKGQTYDQLVQRMSQVKKVDQYLYCHTCDGSPARTYTNDSGNLVAVYLFSTNWNYPGGCSADRYSGSCWDGYSICRMKEQRFEFKDGVIIDAWTEEAESNRKTLYSEVCQEYKGGINGRDGY